ncbi:RalBP1-associated Eps domain-containing protein 2 [Oryzias melastigma]|uniref:RalBP1-associated Eps domain-containing protein 2 n=1 Tax=Oryzias melastigma TaxID=30732 RepID=A0A834CHS6_ORYME|nr:RalBP1-associated Eps domain-containing protein 2 [Oryzias melastigma]
MQARSGIATINHKRRWEWTQRAGCLSAPGGGGRLVGCQTRSQRPSAAETGAAAGCIDPSGLQRVSRGSDPPCASTGMDQESGAAVAAAAAAASGASFISLSEHEQMYFSGLHGLCQADASGKLSSSKVAELLKASQLPAEALHKVTEVCGAKHLGYFGTAQFYVALKLLAAAQSGLPVRLESVTASNVFLYLCPQDLPLPRFVGLKAESEMRYAAPPAGVEPQCGSTTAAATWSPADRSSFRHLEANPDRKEPWSPPRSPCSSPPRSPLTYRSYAHAKQRNGVEAQIPYESKASPRVKAPLEQLSFPAHYAGKASVEPPAAAQTCPSERDQQVTDECDSDPWRITEEQLEYYTNQFKTLQPDLDALILGGVAKNFFTKSKLPIPELSHIWELSDVNKDGALTFPEFCIAFHLIVARKNGYPLPESLPLTLQPGFLLHEEEIPDTPESAEPLIVFEDAESRPSQMDLSVKESPRKNGRKQGLEEDSGAQGGSSSSQGEQTLPSSHRPADAPPVSFRPEPPQDLDLHNRTRTRPRSHSSTSIEEAMKKAEEPPTPPPPTTENPFQSLLTGPQQTAPAGSSRSKKWMVAASPCASPKTISLAGFPFHQRF